MEYKDLSSNWKKLQETLSSTPRPATKRKASEDLNSQARRNGVKRRRADAKKRVMEHESAITVPVVGRPDVKVNETVNEGLSQTAEAGKYLSLDCEMVGVGPTPDLSSALARVSIVNYHGAQIYDSYVRPKEFVTDWRTHVSGILPSHMRNARSLEEVQGAVAGLLEGKILVGHGVRHDLEVLMLGHPKRDVRDTSRHPAFRRLAMGKTPSLKRLAREVLGLEIQGGEHSSVEDARACMLLFKREKDTFEAEHAKRWGMHTRSKLNEAAGENGKKKSKKKKGKK